VNGVFGGLAHFDVSLPGGFEFILNNIYLKKNKKFERLERRGGNRNVVLSSASDEQDDIIHDTGGVMSG
jgi:hypothetical protein